MTWLYQYPAPTAVHQPTGLVFSISYDRAKPACALRLSGERPATMTDAQISALAAELDQLIRDRRTQDRMSHLLHGAYQGDYARAASILSEQTKKKVSVRTLQAWMMPPGRPSSRRCPEWALQALEQYIERHPEAPRQWKDIATIYRDTPDGQTLAMHTELRDKRSLQFAEAAIAEEEALLKKWRSAGFENLPQRLTELELRLQRVTGDHTDLIGKMLALAYSCTTFEEFRPQLQEATMRKVDLDQQVREIVRDIRNGRNEFAHEDGTLPD